MPEDDREELPMIHILVVDDDKKINQTVCTWLNDCGFAAKGVWSANEAYSSVYDLTYTTVKRLLEC